VIIKYLVGVIDYYSRRCGERGYGSMEMLEKNLEKLNAGTSWMIGEQHLRVGRLMGKYLINYGKEINERDVGTHMHNGSSSPSEKYKEINELLVSCRRTINGLINLYRR
jgi:hypothetical protein